ncbi:MAG: MerR family transcriptional regulator [Pseudobutyrivibrio sp.]|nr:MerR family transcriptional regulator [Pseudobutyrivibrio sp.]
MKIYQVEELVGITKKNIRFYEDQGLVCPNRNSDNGYRDYNMEDVKCLNKIKLFRKLEVPLEEIRKLQDNSISITACLNNHIEAISKKKAEMDVLAQMCKEIIESNEDIETMDAEKYLEDMERLEKGGVSFMDIKRVDVKRAKRGPKIAALVWIILMLLSIGTVIYTSRMDDSTPIGYIIIIITILAATIVGVSVSLVQRLREIDGGELNEADKY